MHGMHNNQWACHGVAKVKVDVEVWGQLVNIDPRKTRGL